MLLLTAPERLERKVVRLTKIAALWTIDHRDLDECDLTTLPHCGLPETRGVGGPACGEV